MMDNNIINNNNKLDIVDRSDTNVTAESSSSTDPDFENGFSTTLADDRELILMRQMRRRRRFLIVGGILPLFITAVLLLALWLSSLRHASASRKDRCLYPSSTAPSRYHELARELVAFFQTNTDGCFPTSQLQSDALNWIAVKDSLSLTGEALLWRYVVVMLYYSTGGRGWVEQDFWLTPSGICLWKGVVCAEDGRVVGIHVGHNSLDGTIPSELVLLSDLSFLDLSYNPNLKGSIPSELLQLSGLETLHVDHTEISGRLPSQLDRWTSLIDLRLDNTLLSGSLPTEVGLLTRMESLHLGRAGLSGSLPSEVGQLTKLRWLSLDGNDITGSIPSELAELNKLQTLDLSHNRLGSTVPSQLGMLSDLRILLLNSNDLTGAVPLSLAILSKLTELDIGDNSFDGTFSQVLDQLDMDCDCKYFPELCFCSKSYN